tara:strand:- start:2820 stop:2999 length:180 start_codon:yes stop_codon:yes gene_type:complete
MARVKNRKQVLRMAKYVRRAMDVDEPEPEREAIARAQRLETAGRLRDDGTTVPVHQDEM